MLSPLTNKSNWLSKETTAQSVENRKVEIRSQFVNSAENGIIIDAHKAARIVLDYFYVDSKIYNQYKIWIGSVGWMAL